MKFQVNKIIPKGEGTMIIVNCILLMLLAGVIAGTIIVAAGKQIRIAEIPYYTKAKIFLPFFIILLTSLTKLKKN